MYALSDIRMVHLEVTSKCNAACPQCSRNRSGGPVNEHLPITELTRADIERILPPDIVRQLECVYMCGVYGDAIMASETLEIFEYLRAENKAIWLHLVTNGSARQPAWWAELASVVNRVTFSIDGLADTNHLYRRGTDFARIMRSADAFITAGGEAVWEYLVFRHNEHQVEDARAVAGAMGFAQFIAKKTDRFMRSGKAVSRLPVINKAGEHEYDIEMPSGAEFQNEAVAKVSASDDYKTYRTGTGISCKAVTRRSIYVSAEGFVLPCCWTGRLYVPGGEPEVGQIWDILRKSGGTAALDGKSHALADIIASPFFQEHVPGGWQKGPGRLDVCARQCGEHDVVKAIFA